MTPSKPNRKIIFYPGVLVPTMPRKFKGNLFENPSSSNIRFPGPQKEILGILQVKRCGNI